MRSNDGPSHLHLIVVVARYASNYWQIFVVEIKSHQIMHVLLALGSWLLALGLHTVKIFTWTP